MSDLSKAIVDMNPEEFERYMDELVKEKIEEVITKRTNERDTTLCEARKAHQLRYSMDRYGDETHTVISYFNGWSNISSLVRLAFGEKNVSRIVDKKRANDMAKELSDIFFKYAWFNQEEK